MKKCVHVQGEDEFGVPTRSSGHCSDAPRAAVDCEQALHAVRSSLAGLSGALYVLSAQHTEIPEASRRRVEALLVSEIERLRRLVSAPLDEKLPGTPHTLELDTLISHVVMSRSMCGQEVAWTPSGCLIRGHADDLVEALSILLVNAWRHAEGKPARIEVARQDAQVLVLVSDDGPGVPLDLQPHIFERGARRPGSRGQGIGLAMARDLVESLGGTLTLSRSTSGGACFCLALPGVEQTWVA